MAMLWNHRKDFFASVPMTRSILASMFLLLVSCNDHRPPTPTREQADQLNEADTMLNDLANEEGPVDRSAGPSNSSD